MAINPIDGATLVWVRPGSFVMGSALSDVRRLWAQNGWDDELFAAHVGGAAWIGELCPHDVTLDGFWLYGDPLTIGQFASSQATVRTHGRLSLLHGGEVLSGLSWS